MARDDGAVAALIERVFDSARPAPPPLDPRGTPFQRRVWSAPLALPRGRTTTYHTLARQLQPASVARAVGGAVAANPIAVAIPCHRVVGARGALTGYRWGLERKAALLAWERGG